MKKQNWNEIHLAENLFNWLLFWHLASNLYSHFDFLFWTLNWNFVFDIWLYKFAQLKQSFRAADPLRGTIVSIEQTCTIKCRRQNFNSKFKIKNRNVNTNSKLNVKIIINWKGFPLDVFHFNFVFSFQLFRYARRNFVIGVDFGRNFDRNFDFRVLGFRA